MDLTKEQLDAVEAVKGKEFLDFGMLDVNSILRKIKKELQKVL